MRNTRYRGRWQSRSVARGGRRIAGRPSPIMRGAMAMCRRSSRFASRNADTVTPPPSTKIRAQELDHLAAGGVCVEPQDGRAAELRFTGPPERLGAGVHRRRRIVAEDSIFAGKSPARIEHDAQRIRTGHVAGRELRIVGRHRTRADDDGVAECAHAVQMKDVLVAGDKLRLARVHRDKSVQALAEMTDRDRPRGRCAADGQIQIEQRVARVAGGQTRLPSGAGLPDNQRIRMAGGQCVELLIAAQGKCNGLDGAGQPVGAARGGQGEAPRAIRAPIVGSTGGWLHGAY